MKQKIKNIPIVSQIMNGKIDDNIDLFKVDDFEEDNTFTTYITNKLLTKMDKPQLYLITEPFFNAMKSNINSFVNNREIYLSMEPMSGVLIWDSRIICYSLKRDGDNYAGAMVAFNNANLFECLGVIGSDIIPQNEKRAMVSIHPSYLKALLKIELFKGMTEHEVKCLIVREYINIIVSFHVLKKYAEVETKILEPHSKNRAFNCKYYNDTDHQIQIMDSTWFTMLVKSDEFKVRGHFRFQPCGQAFRDKKLIWIKDFKKEGYTRKARKELEIA
jgi:hypothetical protein